MSDSDVPEEEILKYLDVFKSKGIFDKLRQEAFSEIDTKQQVESSVASHLMNIEWNNLLSKNEIRNKMRTDVLQSKILSDQINYIVNHAVNVNLRSKFSLDILRFMEDHLLNDKKIPDYIIHGDKDYEMPSPTDTHKNEKNMKADITLSSGNNAGTLSSPRPPLPSSSPIQQPPLPQNTDGEHSHPAAPLPPPLPYSCAQSTAENIGAGKKPPEPSTDRNNAFIDKNIVEHYDGDDDEMMVVDVVENSGGKSISLLETTNTQATTNSSLVNDLKDFGIDGTNVTTDNPAALQALDMIRNKLAQLFNCNNTNTTNSVLEYNENNISEDTSNQLIFDSNNGVNSSGGGLDLSVLNIDLDALIAKAHNITDGEEKFETKNNNNIKHDASKVVEIDDDEITVSSVHTSDLSLDDEDQISISSSELPEFNDENMDNRKSPNSITSKADSNETKKLTIEQTTLDYDLEGEQDFSDQELKSKDYKYFDDENDEIATTSTMHTQMKNDSHTLVRVRKSKGTHTLLRPNLGRNHQRSLLGKNSLEKLTNESETKKSAQSTISSIPKPFGDKKDTQEMSYKLENVESTEEDEAEKISSTSSDDNHTGKTAKKSGKVRSHRNASKTLDDVSHSKNKQKLEKGENDDTFEISSDDNITSRDDSKKKSPPSSPVYYNEDGELSPYRYPGSAEKRSKSSSNNKTSSSHFPLRYRKVMPALSPPEYSDIMLPTSTIINKHPTSARKKEPPKRYREYQPISTSDIEEDEMMVITKATVDDEIIENTRSLRSRTFNDPHFGSETKNHEMEDLTDPFPVALNHNNPWGPATSQKTPINTKNVANSRK